MTASAGSMSIPPTANPYAALPDSGDDSPRMQACRNALRSAPYQMPPLRTAVGGAGAECAHITALALLDQKLSSSGGSVAVDSAAVLSLVTRWASGAALSGVCPAVQASDLATERGTMMAYAGQLTGRGCPVPTVAGTIELPGTIATQSVCGQRVDQSAVSPGDLVFWQYSSYVPSRAGVAVGDGQVVSVDPVTDQVVLAALPVGRDVRVKRVLTTA
ncbi:hypothetical protein ACFROC_00440 [Nocardia tengchongensis]|uniref:hypothetical protein n=1 Tax=Nocardia tengchongensis TaxID=2055889 RepID=UPI0036C42165